MPSVQIVSSSMNCDRRKERSTVHMVALHWHVLDMLRPFFVSSTSESTRVTSTNGQRKILNMGFGTAESRAFLATSQASVQSSRGGWNLSTLVIMTRLYRISPAGSLPSHVGPHRARCFRRPALLPR